MKKLILFFCFLSILIILPIISKAETITCTGCFIREQNYTDLTVRMLALEASINFSDANNIYNISVENLDPDYVVVDNYLAGSLARSASSMNFQTSIAGNGIINITPWPEISDDFYFAAFGDSQITATDEGSANRTFTEVLSQIDVINPFFSTVSGDIVSTGSTQEMHQGRLEKYTELVGAISVPNFPSPGNHDWYGGNLDDYLNYFGTDNYSFDYSNTHFVMSSSGNRDSRGYWDEDQQNWLTSDLQASSQENKLVFFHHALSKPSWASSEGYYSEDNRNQVASLLESLGCDMTISGHHHGYEYSFLDNTKIPTLNFGYYQLVTGGAGATIYQEADGFHHFILMHVNGANIEQTIIGEDDFPISREFLNNNDGQEDSSAILVANDGDDVWPWVRLKFKVSPDISHVYAYDQDGNYLSFIDNSLDEYRVAYIETDIPAGVQKLITVGKCTKIHTGVTNNVYANGEVSYSQLPENNATEINLQAIPTQDFSQIIVNDWQINGEYYRQWEEIASTSDSNTDYIIGDLDANYRYKIVANGNMYHRAYPNDNNEISFTYNGGDQVRIIEVIKETEWWPNNIALIPANEGSPHIRIFNSTGQVISQYYGYKKKWQGGYKLIQADVNGDFNGEIIIIPENGLLSQIKVFTESGDLIDQITVVNDKYKNSANIKTADIDGDSLEELIVAPLAGSNAGKIIIYKFNIQTNQFDLLLQKRVYENIGVNLALADVNLDNKMEIIATPKTANANLKIFCFLNNNLSLLAQKKVFSNNEVNGITAAVGEINNSGYPEIIVGPAESGGSEIKVFRINDKNKLKYIQKKQIFSKSSSNASLQIVSGDLNGDLKDEVIVAPANGEYQVRIYQSKKGKFKLIKSLKPYGADFFEGMNIALFDIDENADLELVIAPKYGGSKIFVYNNEENEIKKQLKFTGYSNDFIGGVNLINNL